MTRSTVHYTHDGVLESEDVLDIREMTPHGDDGDHGGGGVALLLQLLEDIRRPAVAVTLLASGREEVVPPDCRVLGVHRYGHYRDDVDTGLLTYRAHVLSPFYD